MESVLQILLYILLVVVVIVIIFWFLGIVHFNFDLGLLQYPQTDTKILSPLIK